MSYKVYYEDTDSLGIVYYANYLKYMERGRSEFVAASTGRGVADFNKDGVLIVVHQLQMTFRQAANLGDTVDVVSSFTLASRYRGTFHQRCERAGEVLTTADVDVVCLDRERQLVSFPDDLRAMADA